MIPHPQLEQHLSNRDERSEDVARFIVGNCSGEELIATIASLVYSVRDLRRERDQLKAGRRD